MELRASVSWSITGAIIVEKLIVSEFLEAQFQREKSVVCVRRKENGTKEIKGGICLHSVQFPVRVCTK